MSNMNKDELDRIVNEKEQEILTLFERIAALKLSIYKDKENFRSECYKEINFRSTTRESCYFCVDYDAHDDDASRCLSHRDVEIPFPGIDWVCNDFQSR